jgi:hypothetical protein
MDSNGAPSIEELRMRREVLALREALEAAQFQAEMHATRAASAHRAEVEELQSMIRSLREVLDAERAAHAEALTLQRRELGAVSRDLQEALVAARDAFDAERLALQARHQNDLVAAGRIPAELEATVKQLRESIDGAG